MIIKWTLYTNYEPISRPHICFAANFGGDKTTCNLIFALLVSEYFFLTFAAFSEIILLILAVF